MSASNGHCSAKEYTVHVRNLGSMAGAEVIQLYTLLSTINWYHSS